jgi:hypothetical protein
MQIQMVNREEAEKVFITVKATDVAAGIQTGGLYPGQCVEWVSTTTDADQGYVVQKAFVALNATSGIAAKIAGVVETTISTGAVGRLQVYGPGNVRASSSLDGPTMVVASSINATNIGHVEAATQSTLTSPHYLGAYVGWTLEDGPNATNSTVFIDLL